MVRFSGVAEVMECVNEVGTQLFLKRSTATEI